MEGRDGAQAHKEPCVLPTLHFTPPLTPPQLSQHRILDACLVMLRGVREQSEVTDDMHCGSTVRDLAQVANFLTPSLTQG